MNLSSILYLGALASANRIGSSTFFYCMYGLAIFAIFITLGGMKVIGYTDVIQVFVLVLGGLATTYLALDLVADHFGSVSGAWEGLGYLRKEAADHFSMILDKGEIMIPNGEGGTRDAYMDLPGLSVLVGGMWIINLNYWGCNQYITQRALGADLKTARSGLFLPRF